MRRVPTVAAGGPHPAGVGRPQLRHGHPGQPGGGQRAARLRGVERAASSGWLGVLGTVQLTRWRFEQRNRRPPRDPISALLSLGYTWLLARVIARCEAEGMEVNLGGLHEY